MSSIEPTSTPIYIYRERERGPFKATNYITDGYLDPSGVCICMCSKDPMYTYIYV